MERQIIHRITIIFLSFILFQACTNKENNSKKEVERNILSDNDFEIVVIDSCEYIVFDRVHGYAGSGGICHKQNCKFCANISKK